MIRTVDNLRSCGTCHACCDLQGIEEINKPAGDRCPNLNPKGGTRRCSVFGTDQDVQSCRTFDCGWRWGLGKKKERPDELGAIVWFPDSGMGQVVRIAVVRRGIENHPSIQKWIRGWQAEGMQVSLSYRDQVSIVPLTVKGVLNGSSV